MSDCLVALTAACFLLAVLGLVGCVGGLFIWFVIFSSGRVALLYIISFNGPSLWNEGVYADLLLEVLCIDKGRDVLGFDFCFLCCERDDGQVVFCGRAHWGQAGFGL